MPPHKKILDEFDKIYLEGLKKDRQVEFIRYSVAKCFLLLSLEKVEKQAREEALREGIEIVLREHYILEEWFSSEERPRDISCFSANQKTIETRNKITASLRKIINKENENV